MSKFCKVSGCRYSTTHVTFFHQCNKCKMLGHGQKECGNYEEIMKLNEYQYDRLPNLSQCSYQDCSYKEFHTSGGHCCPYCGSRNNKHMKKCIKTYDQLNQLLTVEYLFEDYKPDLTGLTNNMYSVFSCGMGCSIYARNTNNIIEYYFMHCDNWGQYGEDTSDIPILNAFKLGYIYVDLNK